MNGFLVTGVSGAGRSTVARQLRVPGRRARSADAALGGWYDGQERPVTGTDPSGRGVAGRAPVAVGRRPPG